MFFWHKIFHSSVESVYKLLTLILIRKSTYEIYSGSLDTHFLNFKAKNMININKIEQIRKNKRNRLNYIQSDSSIMLKFLF